jgi:hypothetical protein
VVLHVCSGRFEVLRSGTSRAPLFGATALPWPGCQSGLGARNSSSGGGPRILSPAVDPQKSSVSKDRLTLALTPAQWLPKPATSQFPERRRSVAFPTPPPVSFPNKAVRFAKRGRELWSPCGEAGRCHAQRRCMGRGCSRRLLFVHPVFARAIKWPPARRACKQPIRSPRAWGRHRWLRIPGRCDQRISVQPGS